jgi:hypothetical protein
MFAMATSAGVLILASVLSFGVEAWIGFLVHTQPMITAILKAPWEALPAQQIFASVFMAARSLGASWNSPVACRPLLPSFAPQSRGRCGNRELTPILFCGLH